jgi:hypothetical protein
MFNGQIQVVKNSSQTGSQVVRTCTFKTSTSRSRQCCQRVQLARKDVTGIFKSQGCQDVTDREQVDVVHNIYSKNIVEF